MADQDLLYNYILHLGDNSMILGQRLGELCGHGPELETDIALTNISLDLFGEVRNYFQYAAEIKGDGKTEDDIAMLRLEHEYRNCLLPEQPNTDFAFVIARQYFYDQYHYLLLQVLVNSTDETLTAIAKKSIKEAEYHLDLSETWMRRLGDGTEESNQRLQHAVNELYRFTEELVTASDVEVKAAEAGLGPDLNVLKQEYQAKVSALLQESKIEEPKEAGQQFGGKEGRHSEFMGYILADFQFMQRAYPNMKW